MWVAGEKVTVINNDPFFAQLTTERGKVRTSPFNVIQIPEYFITFIKKTI